MALCEKHTRFIPKGQECGECWKETASASKKAVAKKKKTKPSRRQLLKLKLQSLVSKIAKYEYRKRGYYYDWIGKKTNNNTGLFGLHASHYYPKGEVWQLWTDLVNIGLSSHHYNVVNQSTVTLLRSTMIEVWGEDKVLDLDMREKEYRQRIKMGIDPRFPTDIWLIGKIEECKQIIKNQNTNQN